MNKPSTCPREHLRQPFLFINVKGRPVEGMRFAQGHTASWWQNRGPPCRAEGGWGHFPASCRGSPTGPEMRPIRVCLSVIDFQALNFYQNELMRSVGRRKVPGITCLLGQRLGCREPILPSFDWWSPPPGGRRGVRPRENAGQDAVSSGNWPSLTLGGEVGAAVRGPAAALKQGRLCWGREETLHAAPAPQGPPRLDWPTCHSAPQPVLPPIMDLF